MKLLKFYTDTCQPCKMMTPVVRMACEQTGLEFEDVDAMTDKRAVDLDIKNVPTLVLINGDSEVDRHVGMIPLKHLVEWINEHEV